MSFQMLATKEAPLSEVTLAGTPKMEFNMHCVCLRVPCDLVLGTANSWYLTHNVHHGLRRPNLNATAHVARSVACGAQSMATISLRVVRRPNWIGASPNLRKSMN